MSNQTVITLSDSKVRTTFGALNVGDTFVVNDLEGDPEPFIKTEEGAQRFGEIFSTLFVPECLVYKAKKVHVEY